jgi:hypothetical protein
MRKFHNNELHNLTKNDYSYQIKKNETGGACGKYGGEER